MEKEKLMVEYRVTLESLVEKTKFVYSEEFYTLDEFEKQKYQKDKMATEGHLSTLCALLWGKTPQISSITDLFAMSIVGSMLGGGGWGGQTSCVDYLKKTHDDDEKEKQEKVYAIPVNEN